eukprot:m.12463 g.12463  ORF g.12463 m.12463 type:complete len:53 (+) comp5826_c0_seq2:3102-3260(+)
MTTCGQVIQADTHQATFTVHILHFDKLKNHPSIQTVRMHHQTYGVTVKSSCA